MSKKLPNFVAPPALLLVLSAILFSTSPTRAAEIPPTVPYFGLFTEAPPTSIQPKGWLAQMLQRQANGLATHHAVSGYPYDTCLWAGKIPTDANPQSKQWWPYEQSGYLVDGLERLGLTTNNEKIQTEAAANIQYILDHPQPDGSLGPTDIGPTNWPHAVVFRALMAAYDAHPDPAIVEALHRHFLTRPENFGAGRDVCNVEPILWTYAHTADPRLLKLAQQTYTNFNKTKPHSGLAALLGDSIIIEHGVTFNETAKIPALLFLYTGDKSMLSTSLNGYRKIDRDHMLADGLHSAEERLDGSNPWSYHETCDISDYTWSVGYLLLASGDCTWADHIEKTIFNAGFGAITKDFKSLQYFSSPNQVVSAPGICKKYNPDRLAYRPGHDVECCSGNVERFLPNFALRQWLLTPSGGIVAALYSPSSFSTTINQTKLTIDENTDYPFSETIQFVIHTSQPISFPLLLRIPGWTTSPQLQINGQNFEGLGAPGSFTTVSRTFTDGDTLTLHLPMPLKIHQWDHQTASIERGPLVYSLKIDETATPIWGTKTSPDFPAWDKRPASKWNYALALNKPDATDQLHLTTKPVDAFPWDIGHSPIVISAPVREITNWHLAPNGANPGFPTTPQFSDQIQTADFVPDGTTCLRLTVLPVIGETPNAPPQANGQ
jgi:uncharacterized protein